MHMVPIDRAGIDRHLVGPSNLSQQLTSARSKLESDPNNPELRKLQKTFTKIVNWIRQDTLKRHLRQATN